MNDELHTQEPLFMQHTTSYQKKNSFRSAKTAYQAAKKHKSSPARTYIASIKEQSNRVAKCTTHQAQTPRNLPHPDQKALVAGRRRSIVGAGVAAAAAVAAE